MFSMKYMKLKSLIFFGLISLSGFAQEEDPLSLPNYTPPSPEASAITKYSDVTINEHTGMVSKTIPIYTYKAGNLELPISLNYSGSGVKVDDLPTWVGMNWTLSAGGVITRNVRDIADETAVSRVFFNDNDVVNYNSTLDGTSNGAFLRSIVSNSQVDSEVDIFQYNFAGYSGSFYLDNNWNAKLLKNDTPIKINIINQSEFYNNKRIIITTPDGVVYTFGGANATEETSRRTVVNGSMQPQDTFEGTTAFYLTSIEHPLFGDILFEYIQNLGNEIIVTQKIQSRKKILDKNDLGTCEDSQTGMQTPACVNNQDDNDSSFTTTISTRVLNPKYLSKIYSYNHLEQIHFISESIDNRYFKRALNEIIVDKDNNLSNGHFNKIKLNYIGRQASSSSNGYSDVSKRFFLHEVIFNEGNNYSFNTSSGRRNEVFTFEYDGYNSLPSRFDFSQDYGGYYNGISNMSALPNVPFFNPTNNNNFADRTPDFEFASKGALSKIIYPTSGYTIFEYESPKAKKEVTETISLNTYRNQSGLVNTSDLYDGVPKISEGEDTDGDGVIDSFTTIFGDSIIQNQTIIVSVNTSAYLSNNYPTFFPNQEKVTLKFTDLSTNVSIDKVITFAQPSGPNNEGYVNKTKNYEFNLEAGKLYKVELFIEDTSADEVAGTEVPMLATATFSYFKGYQITDGVGVRLKKHTNFTSQAIPQEIKRYYYGTIDKLEPSIDELGFISGSGNVKTSKEIINKICSPNVQCFGSGGGNGPIFSFIEIYYLFNVLSSEKYDFLSATDAGLYPNVTISYGGDNFENGGVEKTFSKFDDYGATQIKTFPGLSVRSSVQGLDWVGTPPEVLNDYKIPSSLNGILIKEKVYKNQSVLKKVQEKNYTYDFGTIERFNCVFSKKEFDALFFEQPINVNNTASNYTIGSYIVESRKSELTQKQTIEYIDPVPLGVQDESIYKKIVSIQNYQYGNLRGLPTVITSSSSESGINNITKNFYVTDNLSGLGLSSGQVNLLSILANKNIVNKPIQTEQFQNTEKLSTIRTVYKNISTNSNFYKIVPDIIESSKENQTLEKRVRFLEYDGFGRPTLVSLENGAKTKYYYNVRGQVVMKIENYIAPVGTGTSFTGEDVESSTSPCNYQTMFPASLVTVFEYDLVNNQIVKIIDSNCIETNYEYDELNRLIYIKDNEGNIMQEFDSSFKRY